MKFPACQRAEVAPGGHRLFRAILAFLLTWNYNGVVVLEAVMVVNSLQDHEQQDATTLAPTTAAPTTAAPTSTAAPGDPVDADENGELNHADVMAIWNGYTQLLANSKRAADAAEGAEQKLGSLEQIQYVESMPADGLMVGLTGGSMLISAGMLAGLYSVKSMLSQVLGVLQSSSAVPATPAYAEPAYPHVDPYAGHPQMTARRVSQERYDGPGSFTSREAAWAGAGEHP